MQRVVGAATEAPPARASGPNRPPWHTLVRWLMPLRPAPLVLLVAWWMQSASASTAATAEPDLKAAVARALAERSLTADAAEVFVVDAPPGTLASRWSEPRAVLRAQRTDEPADIYLARLRLSPEGRLLEVTGLYNLSDTSAVDEQKLVVDKERAAWTIGGADKTFSIHVADLSGEAGDATAHWTTTKRWQHRITNLQETGQKQGVARRSFKLDPAASQASLAFAGDALLVNADGRSIKIPADGAAPVEGRHYVREQPHHVARPGNLVTWAVDRVRALPWFGSDRMQAVKAVAFAGLDWLQRGMGAVTGDDGAEQVAEQMGELMSAPLIEYSDPKTGWPPPALEPMLSPALEGEGKWRQLDGDPFVGKHPSLPSPFVTTFIRTDRKRAYSQIFVVTWDPRQVELSTMSGTVEPKSATGETGPGLVPREPKTMRRLVAAFNGGFQATHGEFGMMAEGVLYLPPKPYAATVAKLQSGDTGFGTWPDSEEVPDNFVGFRQNMNPLVMDGDINPYKRNWWGGVPPGWTDEARTVRSGVCQTKENFITYFYGSSIDADHLALAMQRARCVYGIHLDMNPGHTGLEFYRAAPAGQLPTVGHDLDSQWEATGKVKGMDGWEFLGRRMIRYMGLMNFPRYIQRESRDFFYLTLRPLLPAPDLTPAIQPAEKNEGKWTLSGLPQHGFPYAVTTTWLRPDKQRPDTKVRVMQLDPRMVKTGEGKVVATFIKATGNGKALWLDEHRLSIAERAPSPKAVALARAGGEGPPVAAVGITDDDMLVYAAVATAYDAARDGALLTKLLAEMGCSAPLLLSAPLKVALGGDRDLSGHPMPGRKDALRLVRAQGPGVRRIFPDTPIVEPKVWYPKQAKRVRYFRKPKTETPSGSEAGGASGESGGGEAAPPSPAPPAPAPE